MTTTLEDDALAELGLSVPIAEIESRLLEFWEGDQDRARVSMMNLVVFSEKTGSLLENSRAIRELAEEHACRAILTEIQQEQNPASIRAWITAHCHMVQGNKATCSEQIAFHLIGTASGRFRNTVFSHLHADLPVVFWWQGELTSIFTERLTSVIDRLVVDSASWDQPKDYFETILKMAKPDLVIQDFSWTRTWQLRLSIAGLFDDLRAQSLLPAMDRITVRYSGKHRTSLLQVLGWLAIQAGWSVKRSSEVTAFLHPDERDIVVDLQETDDGPPITQLSLHSGDEFAEFLQDGDSNHIRRRLVTRESEINSLSPIDPTGDVELLAELLSRGGQNTMFRKILPPYLELADLWIV